MRKYQDPHREGIVIGIQQYDSTFSQSIWGKFFHSGCFLKARQWPFMTLSFRRGGFQTRQLTGGIHKSFRAVILWRKDCIRGSHEKRTFISNMMCCMLCTVNTDLIWSHFFLAYRNGSDLHGYLHIGQEREIQTQVVTWDTFQTNSGAVSQLKSESTQSRHSQDLMYWFCSIWWILFCSFTIYFNFHVC